MAIVRHAVTEWIFEVDEAKRSGRMSRKLEIKYANALLLTSVTECEQPYADSALGSLAFDADYAWLVFLPKEHSY